MTHEEALDSAVEAFIHHLKARGNFLGSPVPGGVITACRQALEHYRIERGEGDG